MASDIDAPGRLRRAPRSATGRRTTETRRSWMSSELYVYVAAAAAILIAGAVTSADGTSPDSLNAHDTWLYFAIVTAGYLIARGLAKAGSREPYPSADLDAPALRERDPDDVGRYARPDPARVDPVTGRAPAP
jgi:hypothetical protein